MTNPNPIQNSGSIKSDKIHEIKSTPEEKMRADASEKKEGNFSTHQAAANQPAINALSDIASKSDITKMAEKAISLSIVRDTRKAAERQKRLRREQS
jgi:hypothetical protein